jgi:hypothetical protein
VREITGKLGEEFFWEASESASQQVSGSAEQAELAVLAELVGGDQRASKLTELAGADDKGRVSAAWGQFSRWKCAASATKLLQLLEK